MTVVTGIEPLPRDRFLRVVGKFETLGTGDGLLARLEHQRDAINAGAERRSGPRPRDGTRNTVANHFVTLN